LHRRAGYGGRHGLTLRDISARSRVVAASSWVRGAVFALSELALRARVVHN
jgi:hypothetical protein